MRVEKYPRVLMIFMSKLSLLYINLMMHLKAHMYVIRHLDWDLMSLK